MARWVRLAAFLCFGAISAQPAGAQQSGGGPGHAAALLPDQTIVVMGGVDPSGLPSSGSFSYAPGSSTASPTGSLVLARSHHTATPLYDGRILIVGGNDGYGAMESVEIFDPVTSSYHLSAAVLAAPRQDHEAIGLADGTVLIRGGYDRAATVTLDELYDPRTDTVTTAAPGLMVANIATDFSDYLPGNTVYVSGSGFNPGENVALLFDEEPLTHAPHVFTAVADAAGSFFQVATLLVQDHDYGATFFVHADGASSAVTADTSFTDGDSFQVTASITAPAGATDGTFDTGQQITVSVSVQNKTTGQTATSFTGVNVTVQGLPAGWQVSPVSLTSQTVPSTLASNATGVATFQVTAPTAGTTTLTFVANGTPTSGTCTGQVNCTGSGKLVNINAVSPGALAVSVSNPNPVVFKAGASTTFTLTISNTGGARLTTSSVSVTPSTLTGDISAVSCSTIAAGTAIQPGNSSTPTTTCTVLCGGQACSAGKSGTFKLQATVSGADDNGVTAASATSALSSAATLDAIAPIVTVQNQVAEAATKVQGKAGAVVTYSPAPSATDNYPTNPTQLTPTCTPASGSFFQLGVTTVSCSATDQAGNTTTGSFTVTVQDTTPPTIKNVPANQTLDATSPAGAVATWTAPNATDIVDGPVQVTCTPLSGSTFPIGVNTVTCTATDSHGNIATATFTITVNNTLDTTPPVITVPADFTVAAVDGTGATVTYTASATDNVDGTITPSCSPASGTKFAIGPTTVTCTATDAAGNPALSKSFVVTVTDQAGPVLTLPADFTVAAVDASGATATYSASALDNVSGSITPSCSPASGTKFPLGPTTVTCTATDAAGNQASGSFVITVSDQTGPVLTLPASITAQATQADGAKLTFVPKPSAVDAVDGTLLDSAITCSPDESTVFPLATDANPTTTVTCTATDKAGNSSTGTFTVKVLPATPTNLTLPADPDLIDSPNGDDKTVTYTPAPTAQDDQNNSLTVTCDPASGTLFKFDAATVVTCSATDSNRNTFIGHFTVKVTDETPPVISGMPANMTVEATGPTGAAATWTSPTATDLFDGSVSVTCIPASGSTFALGTNSVTCSATDAHGNKASTSFSVTVQDTTPPTISGTPANQTKEATGPTGAAATWTSPTASDLVDGTVAVTCTPASGSTFALGTSTVTCAATDAHGNKASTSFSVTVQDTTPPTISGTPANQTKEATGPTGAVATWTSPTASDLVDGTVAVSCTPVSGSTFAIGTATVTCSATDAHGNSASTNFTVTVQDTTPPVVTVPSDINVVATSATGNVVTYSASATDIVDGSVGTTCTPASGSKFLGATTVTCSATDAHGNTGTATFHVNVGFSWTGFLQPIDPDGASVFKLGRTVPVKFQLTGASANITDLVANIYLVQVSNVVVGSDFEAVSTSSADVGNTFRYDPIAKQYIFNLATNGLHTGTWYIGVNMHDGASTSLSVPGTTSAAGPVRQIQVSFSK